jgi:hypothetical protein
MKNYFFLALLVLLVFPITVHAQTNYPKPYQIVVMNEVVATLKNQSQQAISIDPQLCEVAEKLAQEHEDLSPEGFKGSLFSDSRFKDLMTKYKSYDISKVNKNHLLLKLELANGGITTFSEENAIQAFANLEQNGVLLNTKYQHGCVGISEGNKDPIMLYIGAELKIDPAPSNEKTSFWKSIFGFLTRLFQ